MIPITLLEIEFVQENGPKLFISLLKKQQPNLLNLQRQNIQLPEGKIEKKKKNIVMTTTTTTSSSNTNTLSKK